MIFEEFGTGRILARKGGWDVRGSVFNRATQAKRQPGSTFEPIVYSAAIDGGMTPASIITDGPFCVWQGRSEEHTSELQSLMRISYAVFCLKKKHPMSHLYTDVTSITNYHTKLSNMH